jgi:hypothetical protein
MKIAPMAFATLLAAVAHAEVHLTFDHPERYSASGDARPNGCGDDTRVLKGKADWPSIRLRGGVVQGDFRGA